MPALLVLSTLDHSLKPNLLIVLAIAGLCALQNHKTAQAQTIDPLYKASAYSLYVHPNGWDRTGYFPLGVLFPRDDNELASYGFDFSEQAAGPMIDPGGNLTMDWFTVRNPKPLPVVNNPNVLGQFEASWSWHLMPVGDDIPGYAKFTPARSYFDPIVRRYMLVSDAALARIYGASSRPVMMWSLDNEWEGGLDYTVAAQAGFVAWLKTAYGTVAAMDAAWGADYKDWDAVVPPKSEAVVSNGAAWLDWHAYQDDYFTRFTADRYRAIYQADSRHRPIAQKTTQQSFDLPSVGKDRVLDPAQLCDLTRPFGGWYGVDIYDADDSYIYQVNFASQCIQPASGDASGRLFLTETNNHGGPGRQFANSIWRSLANGAKAYDFFCFGMPGATGDSDEYGLTSPSTLLRDKAPYAVRFAYNVRRTEKFWAQSRPSAGVHRVAILLNRQDMLMDDDIPGNIWAGPSDSRENVFAALRQSGYWVDVLPYTKLHAQYLKRYDALFLVNSDHLSSAECGQIKAYVTSGGAIVADDLAGYYDPHHQPAHGLDGVLGVELQPGKIADITSIGSSEVTRHAVGKGMSIYVAAKLGMVQSIGCESVSAWLRGLLIGERTFPEYTVDGMAQSSLRVESPYAYGDNLALVIANSDKAGHASARVCVQLPSGSWRHALWSPAENEDLIPVHIERDPDGRYTFDLPAIPTAGMLLLLNQNPPLIAVKQIPSAKKGIDGYLPVLTAGHVARIIVTVYNPSSKAEGPGVLSARALRGWNVQPAIVRTPKIPAYGGYSATISVAAPNGGVLPYGERMYPINLHWSGDGVDRSVTTTPVGVDIDNKVCPWLLTGNSTYPANFPRKMDTGATYRYVQSGNAVHVQDPATGSGAPNTALVDGYSRWLTPDESAYLSGPAVVEFDLKGVYPLHEVRLLSSDFGGYPTRMDVSISVDGKTYVQAGSATPVNGPGSGKWLSLDSLDGKSAQFIRLNVTLQGGSGNIDEVEIWGYPKQ